MKTEEYEKYLRYRGKIHKVRGPKSKITHPNYVLFYVITEDNV